MRVVVDVNLAPAWADRLRALGHDAHHWSQIGALDATDSEILAWALEHDTIVVSCDLDFGAILAASQACAPSVVQIRARDVMSEIVAQRVSNVLTTFGRELGEGAIISVDLDIARVRILPLGDRDVSSEPIEEPLV